MITKPQCELMEGKQYQSEMMVKRYRSNTVATVNVSHCEFRKMNSNEGHSNTESSSKTLDKANSEDSYLSRSQFSQSRRLSSLESKDSLRLIKQRRDFSLRSLFHQVDRLVECKEGGHVQYRPTMKGRSVSAPPNRINIDYGTTDHEERTILKRNLEELQKQHQQLVHKDMDVIQDKKVSFYKEALLHDAIQRDDLTELCDLLNKHQDIDLELANSYGLTPLHRAAIDGSYRCLNLLLSRNVNVKVRDIYGWTPLHDAVYHGHIRCAAALITAGSNVEAETNDFTKPIEMAHEDEMLLLVGRAMTSPGYVYDPDRETLV